jgi:peptide/nickel transport system permease protein
MLAYAVVGSYFLAAVFVWFFPGAIDWQTTVGDAYQAPSLESWSLWFGTDFLGRSVLFKILHGARLAMTVATVSSVLAVVMGVVAGSVAGFFKRVIDVFFNWATSVLSSVPNILLLLAFALVFGRGWFSVCLALALTGSVNIARVIRAEAIKQVSQEYVVAATSVGAGRWRVLFRHVIPNVLPVAWAVLPLQFAAAIKAEVILSFLGLGAQGQPSWGVMLDDARMELFKGVWWQAAAAAGAMFFVVLALNLLGDCFSVKRR